LFTHDTFRELDPHWHSHCTVFNATFDSVEHGWTALQNHELLRARKFAENAHYHELARQFWHSASLSGAANQPQPYRRSEDDLGWATCQRRLRFLAEDVGK
jgi:hypothetical protein